MIVGADWIKVINDYGAQRLQIDGLVVQQNLRNINMTTLPSQPNSELEVHTSGFDNKSQPSPTNTEDLLTASHQYYDLFLKGPDRILAFVKDKKKAVLSASRSPARKPESAAGVPDLEAAVGYTYDELRTLIELCYSVKLKSPDWEESVKAKRAMGDNLMTLGELMWDAGAPGLGPTVSNSAASVKSGRSGDSLAVGDGGGPVSRGRSGERRLLGLEQAEVFYAA